MADATFAEIVAGRDEATVFTRLITLLQALPSGRSLPALYWGGGDPLPTLLEHGFAPLMSEGYRFAAAIAKGGALRLALAMANANLAAWNTDPMDTFLGWLASDWFAVDPDPPAFTLGWLRITNAGGAVTLPATFAVKTAAGLVFKLVSGAVTVPGGVSYAQIVADKAGSAYNVQAGTITQLVTSVAGITVSNQPQPPAGSWLITYGGDRETPDSVYTRCRANWARLALLQTSPADAYIALAKDRRITGLTSITKVAVWPHFRHGVGQAANYITLYLGGDAAPISNIDANTAQNRLRPYIGLHDKLVCQPCALANYSPSLTCWLDDTADIGPASVALYAQLALLQVRLAIGGTVYASDLRRAAALVPAIQVVEDALTDYTPAKNALVSLMTSQIYFQVGRP